MNDRNNHNFCYKFCKDMGKHYKKASNFQRNNDFGELIKYNMDLSAAAEKFMLPETGILLADKELRALGGIGNLEGDGGDEFELRLPFPVIALEFWEALRTSDDPAKPKELCRHIIWASELMVPGQITMTSACHIPSEGSIWGLVPPFALPSAKAFERRDDFVFMNLKYKDTWQQFVNGRNGMNQQSLAVIKTFARDDAAVLLFFLNALECSNVQIEDGKADTHGGSKLLDRAHPYDTYKILTIETRPTARLGGGQPWATDHMQSREHIRRGHIRRLVKGTHFKRTQKLWINSVMVNVGVEGGKITKDYKIHKE